MKSTLILVSFFSTHYTGFENLRKSLIFRAEKVLEKCQNDQFGELSERLKLGVKSTVFENHTKKSHLTLRVKRATFTY